MLTLGELEGMIEDTGGVPVVVPNEEHEPVVETWGHDETISEEVLDDGFSSVIGPRRTLLVPSQAHQWRNGQEVRFLPHGEDEWLFFEVIDRIREDAGMLTRLVLTKSPDQEPDDGE
jgi:hypothetical protein